MVLTPTAGGLTVQLTVMYPGTREDALQYSISTSPSSLSRRQTGQQPLPVTDLTTPISGSAEVALGPGTYSVTITVTNEHGSTTSVSREVTTPGRLTIAKGVSLITKIQQVCLHKTATSREGKILRRGQCITSTPLSPFSDAPLTYIHLQSWSINSQ